MDTQKTGEFLRALRKAKGLTQEEVAEQLFLSPKTVSRWESGAGLPDINIISGVAALYGVTVDEILQGEKKTDRSETLTEQTKRLKNDGRARMIRENLLKKYNVFFIVAVSVLGFFLLLEILLGFLVNQFAALVLMPLGMAAALLVEAYGNSEIKRISSENEDDALAAGIEKTKKTIRRKNLLFADIFAGVLLLSLALVGIMFSANGEDIRSFPLYCGTFTFYVFLVCLLAGYLILRSFFSKYRIRETRNLFSQKLYATALVLSVFSALFAATALVSVFEHAESRAVWTTADVVWPEEGGVWSEATRTAESWIFLLFFGLKESFLCRGIAIGFFAAASALFAVGRIIKKQKAVFLLCGTVFSLSAPFISLLDFSGEYAALNPLAIFAAIGSVVCAVLLIVNERRLRKQNENGKSDAQ